MKKDLTEIVMILDRSGSMSNLVEDVIGGANSFIDKQRNEKGDANLTLVLFDDKYDLLYESTDIKDVLSLTKEKYYARGSTALLDALGKTITNVKNRLQNLKNNKPSKVIVVIFTDGLENASVEYKKEQVKKLIDDNKLWEFLFLGANIDSFSESGSMGINAITTSNYSATSKGTLTAFNAVNNAVASYRTDGVVTDQWSKDIE